MQQQTLREEAALVAWARRGGGHQLTTDTIDRALVEVSLNAGQRRMVTEFARSGRRVQLALAPAGAGKTTAMKAFAQAWRSAGAGCTPSDRPLAPPRNSVRPLTPHPHPASGHHSLEVRRRRAPVRLPRRGRPERHYT